MYVYMVHISVNCYTHAIKVRPVSNSVLDCMAKCVTDKSTLKLIDSIQCKSASLTRIHIYVSVHSTGSP